MILKFGPHRLYQFLPTAFRIIMRVMLSLCQFGIVPSEALTRVWGVQSEALTGGGGSQMRLSLGEGVDGGHFCRSGNVIISGLLLLSMTNDNLCSHCRQNTWLKLLSPEFL